LSFSIIFAICVVPQPQLGWKQQGWDQSLQAHIVCLRYGQLHYFGHSGSGFSEKGLRDALDRMKPLFSDKSPFENPPRIPEKIQWVKPKLVCEIYAYRCRGHAQKAAQKNRITSALWERFRNFATSRKTQLGFIVFDCVTCQVGDFLYYPLAILW
jgi:hypothetical protein